MKQGPTDEEVRRLLKAAGWRRQDFDNMGERWFHPNGSSAPVGVTLTSAAFRMKSETKAMNRP